MFDFIIGIIERFVLIFIVEIFDIFVIDFSSVGIGLFNVILLLRIVLFVIFVGCRGGIFFIVLYNIIGGVVRKL